MRREIGSEFWQIPQGAQNGMFPRGTQWFLSGRSALSAIIADMQRQRRIRSVALPSWCCASMIRPFVDAGIAVRFYPVCFDGAFRQDPDAADCDALLLMDYFGFAAGRAAAQSGRIVIRDITHSLFSQADHTADYCFGSLRKWAGFKTGGFAWGLRAPSPAAEEAQFVALRAAAMAQKARYMQGETDEKAHLALYQAAEAHLDGLTGIFAADPADARAAEQLDAAFIRQRRRQNARVLMESLPDQLLFPALSATDCPLFVPLLVPDQRRNALQRHLIAQQIYCPVHWPPSDLHALTPQTRWLYDHTLSLVCDQRYTPADMRRLAEGVQRFFC